MSKFRISLLASAVVALFSPQAIANSDLQASAQQLLSAVNSGDENTIEFHACYQQAASRHAGRINALGLGGNDAETNRQAYHQRVQLALAAVAGSDVSTLTFDYSGIAGTNNDEVFANEGSMIVIDGVLGVSGNAGTANIPVVQLESGRWCLQAASL